MKGFYEVETQCEFSFHELGSCFHVWTPEDFPIIFFSKDDFRIGVGIIGLCSSLFSDIRVITFELMSNHVHFVVAGCEDRIVAMCQRVSKMIRCYAHKSGRQFDQFNFRFGIRKIRSLMEMRNVIIYVNKNGFIVHPEHSPFSYPWGANKYFFNEDAVRLVKQNAVPMTVRERRMISRSRDYDDVESHLFCFDGFVSPISFCDISAGEKIFRNSSNYFFRLSKSVETSKEIAKEIGERLFYNDDELFAAISKLAKEKFQTQNLLTLNTESKIELAKVMYFDYNSNLKQILRFLKIPSNLLAPLGIVDRKF